MRRLVTCGTPHLGSPWPHVEDLASAGLALVANGFGALAGKTLAFLVDGLEGVDDALDAMEPGSPLLRALAEDPAPEGVEYVAIAGDSPFGADDARARRILGKLRLPGAVLEMVFGEFAHDVAVAVSSASGVGRTWSSPPPILRAGCNHITYFSSPAGMAAVKKALEVPLPL